MKSFHDKNVLDILQRQMIEMEANYTVLSKETKTRLNHFDNANAWYIKFRRLRAAIDDARKEQSGIGLEI